MSLILNKTRRVTARMALSIGLAAFGTACNITSPDTPSVSGPSEFGTSITLSASPEVLAQDGASQAVITVFARDAASRPIKGLAIRWNASASTTRVLPLNLSAPTSVTDADGRAAVVLTAPVTPTEAPVLPDFITVSATPVSGSVDEVQSRTVRVQLQPPPGVPRANRVPVAAFVAVPSVGLINEPVTFDARTTTDEDEPCLTRCTYLWDFGDGGTGQGIVVTHTYVAVQADGYTVTLTVVDERNGVDATDQPFIVGPPVPAVP
jgi:PKD repeat protein